MNQWKVKRFVVLTTFLLALVACKNNTEAGNDKEQSNEVGPDALFYDYAITAQDDQPDMAVRLQYRFKTKRGRPLVLDSGHRVLLDTIKMEIDSARFAGTYYEKILPLQGFIGKHSIVFTDKQGKQNKTDFQFLPFSLAQALPEKIRRQTLELEVSHLQNGNGIVQLVLTDTAFFTNDINDEVQLNNSKLIITPQMWNELKNGPINMEIHFEEEKLLKRNGRTNGRLVVHYSIKRQFELID